MLNLLCALLSQPTLHRVIPALGGSEGERKYVERFYDYVDDLQLFVNRMLFLQEHQRCRSVPPQWVGSNYKPGPEFLQEHQRCRIVPPQWAGSTYKSCTWRLDFDNNAFYSTVVGKAYRQLQKRKAQTILPHPPGTRDIVWICKIFL